MTRDFDKQNLIMAMDLDPRKPNRDRIICMLVDELYDWKEKYAGLAVKNYTLPKAEAEKTGD